MPRTTPFTATELSYALDDVGLDDIEGDMIRPDYKGRGMYGEGCFAVVHPDGAAVVLLGLCLGNVVRSAGGTVSLACRIARSARTDQLGRNVVTYFPGWVLKDGE